MVPPADSGMIIVRHKNLWQTVARSVTGKEAVGQGKHGCRLSMKVGHKEKEATNQGEKPAAVAV